MLNATEYDALLKAAVKELRVDFPVLNPAELVHAVARASLEIRAGYDPFFAIRDVDWIEHARVVTMLARKDLEYITGRRSPPAPLNSSKTSTSPVSTSSGDEGEPSSSTGSKAADGFSAGVACRSKRPHTRRPI